MAATEVDVYWHTRLRLWSVREGGRVVAHVPTVTLRQVRFIVSASAVRRVQAQGQRAVCAWARGTRHEAPLYRSARPVLFNPYIEPHFVTEMDDIVTVSDLAYFMEDGRCLALP